MKRYDCYPQIDNNDYLHWYVYEKISEQIVAEFFFEDDAQEYCEFLESGGAFAGFTPSFIIKKVPIQNINENFQAEFA